MFFLTNNRKIIMTGLMDAEDCLSSKKIQEKCSLSRKTLTAEIRKLDKCLIAYGARIQAVKGKGYALQILDEKSTAAFVRNFSTKISAAAI